MADYPTATSTFRTHENLPQQTYDVLDTKTFFAEDLQRVENQLIAVEDFIGIESELNENGLLSALLEIIYPVGAILHLNATTDPNDLFVNQTWVAFAQGRVLVGKNTSGTFNTLGATGGAETHTLTTGEIPGHTHSYGAGAAFAMYVASGGGAGLAGGSNITTATNTASAGGGGSHNNLQPYKVVYIWERTA